MLDAICSIAAVVAREVLDIYRSEPPTSIPKSDGSPLTRADQASHAFLNTELPKVLKLPVVSEENPIPFSERRSSARIWLIDPLDGTKSFLARDDEFTINIALVENGHPIAGVVVAPALDVGYCAGTGHGATKFSLSSMKHAAIKCAAGRSQLIGTRSRDHKSSREEEFFAKHRISQIVEMGSALKLCGIAEGMFDVYPRFEPIKEWDTAAAHCILEAAGGKIISCKSQQPLIYNKESFENGPFIASRVDLMFSDSL